METYQNLKYSANEKIYGNLVYRKCNEIKYFSFISISIIELQMFFDFFEKIQDCCTLYTSVLYTQRISGTIEVTELLLFSTVVFIFDTLFSLHPD